MNNPIYFFLKKIELNSSKNNDNLNITPIYNFILWAQDSSSGNAQTISSQTSQTRSSQSKNYSEAPRSRLEKNDLTDELEELQELYEDGTLSEAQFKKAKNKLLT